MKSPTSGGNFCYLNRRKKRLLTQLLIVSCFVCLLLYLYKADTDQLKNEAILFEHELAEPALKELPGKAAIEEGRTRKIIIMEKQQLPTSLPEVQSELKVDDNSLNQVEPGAVFPPPFKPSSFPPLEPPDAGNLGSGGQQVQFNKQKLSPKELVEFEVGWKANSFNQFLSDRISVRRSLMDTRDQACKDLKYTGVLPKTSIIICFHNEAWTTLLRSVHSVIDRSPADLVEEIVLVDDASTMDHLKAPLDDYMSQFNGRVHVLRMPERVGLIQARMKGAALAKSEVLTFLDSHIECFPGWLEPLLHEITVNNHTVIAPVITIINDENFEATSATAKNVQVGGFTWNMVFTWHYPPKRVLSRPGAPYSPIPTPTIAGGLFSIKRSYFEELGWYDPQFEVWGAENLELSFKTWMCHGQLLIAPCSQVAHVFRDVSPYKWDSKHKSPLGWNNARLAEAILGDDYKNYYFQKQNSHARKKYTVDFGDVTDRKEILTRLKCHSFAWFMENIYPEKFDPKKSLFVGRIRNPSTNLCVDASDHDKIVKVFGCHSDGGNQLWYLSSASEGRRDESCWDANSSPGHLGLYECHGGEGAQYFQYFEQQNKIFSHDRKCLTIWPAEKNLNLTSCDENMLSMQTWVWEK